MDSNRKTATSGEPSGTSCLSLFTETLFRALIRSVCHGKNIFLLRKHRLVVHVLGRPPAEDELAVQLELGPEVEIGNEVDVEEPADPDYTPIADPSSCESGSEVEQDKPHSKHQSNKIRQKNPKNICEYCDFVASVERHSRSAHRSETEKKKLLQLQALEREKGEREAMKLASRAPHSFKCADCDKTFGFFGKLMKHRAVAHPDEEKLKCPYCFNVFNNLVSLKKHILGHDEGTDWSCGECPLRFVTKFTRNKHLEEVHGIHKDPDDHFPLPPQSIFQHLAGEVSKAEKPIARGPKEKRYKCPECHEGFLLANNLGNHRVLVHGATDAERFKCYHCPRVLPTLASFVAHVGRHGEKNQLCADCGKCFATQDYLRQHWALMHNEAAGAKFRAKYKRSREKNKGRLQVKEGKSAVQVTSEESDMEF